MIFLSPSSCAAHPSICLSSLEPPSSSLYKHTLPSIHSLLSTHFLNHLIQFLSSGIPSLDSSSCVPYSFFFLPLSLTCRPCLEWFSRSPSSIKPVFPTFLCNTVHVPFDNIHLSPPPLMITPVQPKPRSPMYIPAPGSWSIIFFLPLITLISFGLIY